MRAFASDIRWSLRLIRHRPAFATTVILTLAGAIAAVATAFGVARAVLWRPLSFADASRLAFVWEDTGANGGTDAARVTGYRFTQWQRQTRAASAMALFGAAGFFAGIGNGPVMINGVRVSSNYFRTLGIAPALGRDFTDADGDPGATRVVMLSHALWKEWFAGRSDAVGQTVHLGGRLYLVIGVMPPIVFPAWPENPATVILDPDARRLWVPVDRTPGLAASSRAHVFGVVARLAPGRTLPDLAAELNTATASEEPDRHGAIVRPFRDQFVRGARLPLIVLLTAALGVLLVACTNLTALQASAIEARRTELGIRAALGAGRLRLARQLATESVILAAAGASLGTALSMVALIRVPALLPPSLPLLTTPSLDARALVLVGALTLAAALLLTVWPLVRTRASDAPAARGTVPLARNTVFRSLVVAQVSLALGLAAPAALLQRSLDAVRGQDAGFVIDRVLVGDVSLQTPAYAGIDGIVSAERTLTARLAALPGVRGAAFAYDQPLAANWLESIALSGSAPRRDDAASSVELRIVSPSYFAAMGVEIVDGRGFTEQDAPGAEGVALVNQAFAARLSDGPALNRTFVSGAPNGTWQDARIPKRFRVVGVVENERFKGLEQPSAPAVYVSTRQFPLSQLKLLLRGNVDAASLAPAARAVIRRFDPTIAVGTMTTLSEILADQLVTRRATTHVVDGFAGAALALAALGLYGLLALSVASRTRETGVRLALGSSPVAEARRVAAECLHSTGIGVACGLGVAAAGGRLVESLLVGVSPTDAATLLMTSAVMLGAALAAAALPAWRAARVDPAVALRA